MRLKNIFRALIGLPVVAAGVSLVAPAADAAYACMSRQVCFYEHKGFTGSVLVTKEFSAAGDHINFRDHYFARQNPRVNADNNISSIKNNTGSTIRLYDYEWSNRRGRWITVNPGGWVADMNNLPVTRLGWGDLEHDVRESFNDTATSAMAT